VHDLGDGSCVVAASRKWKNAEGELQEKTVWFRVAIWGKQAEACAEYMRKGMRVLVVGEVEAPRVFINKRTNEPQCQLEVTADNVRFLSSKDELEAHYRK
jgi:single-strand DNA-binding protein